jgi:outer membrane protein
MFHKKYFLIVLHLFFAGFLSAQTGLKYGHINSSDLLEAMPETDSAKAKLDKILSGYQRQWDGMQAEFNKKYQDYSRNMDTYSPLVRKTKENELRDLNDRIEQFKTSAQEELENKGIEIYNPVLEKANKAISEVARENSFIYIFDLNTGIVVYHGVNSIDILDLVKKKLSLK